MIIYTGNIELDDQALTRTLEDAILASANAMKGFAHPQSVLPRHDCKYLRLWIRGQFAGALLVESPLPQLAELHALYLEGNRRFSRELFDLALIYCQLNTLLPITHVPTLPEYQYMHNFLKRAGMVANEAGNRTVYSLPVGWLAKTAKAYRVFNYN